MGVDSINKLKYDNYLESSSQKISKPQREAYPYFPLLDMHPSSFQSNKKPVFSRLDPAMNFSKFLKKNVFKIQMDFAEKKETEGLLSWGSTMKVEIPFNQGSFIIPEIKKLANFGDNYQTLHRLILKFDGLCEIICNKILMDNLLGKGFDKNFLKDKLQLASLNVNCVKKNHILHIHSFFALLFAYLLSIYPDNLFSIADQWNLLIKGKEGNEINKELLFKALAKIEDGENLKISVFKKKGLSFSGHSLLMKKVASDDYIFFDPNHGEKRGLSFEDLCEELNRLIKHLDGTDIYFCKGSDYLRRLQDLRIIEEAGSIQSSAS